MDASVLKELPLRLGLYWSWHHTNASEIVPSSSHELLNISLEYIQNRRKENMVSQVVRSTEGCRAGQGHHRVRWELQKRSEFALMSPSLPFAQWWRYLWHLRSQRSGTGLLLRQRDSCCFGDLVAITIARVILAGFHLFVFSWEFFCFFLVAHGHMLCWMDARNPVLHMGLPFQSGKWSNLLCETEEESLSTLHPFCQQIKGHPTVTLKYWGAFCTLSNHSLIGSSSCYLEIFPSVLGAGRISGACKHSRHLCHHPNKSRR